MKNILLKLTALAITASMLFVFASCGNDETETDNTTAPVESAGVMTTTPAATEVPSEGASETETGTETESATAPTDVSPVNDNAAALQLYNDAANDVKISKPSLHKKRDIIFKGLQKEIGWLADMVNPFIPEGENETYPTGTDYTSIFPAIGESWSSKLTLNDLSNISCTDNGDTYTIILKLKDETIKTSTTDYTQTITGRAMAVNRSEEIRAGFGDAGTLTVCDQDYYNCSITAVINKSTGKMVSCYHELNLKMYLGGNYGPITLNPDLIQPLLQITENYTEITY